jgi:formylglycine-generating enzyme required for sulfatase activity
MCAMENGSITRDPAEARAWRDGPGAPWMITLSPGAFTMGESPGDKFANHTERPAHRVTVAACALGRFPVTVAEYRAFRLGHNPADPPELPVVNVSWQEAKEYCDWLSHTTGRLYRLPSEAEWEFSCRAGSTEPFAFGHEITSADANFFYSEAGDRIGPGHRTPPGAYPANPFGLHDLHGNVCEWVGDVWHADYQGAPADGSAWTTGGDSTNRVIRGGAWDYLPRLLRSAWRDGLPSHSRRDNVGFRVATSDLPA